MRMIVEPRGMPFAVAHARIEEVDGAEVLHSFGSHGIRNLAPPLLTVMS